MAITLGTLKQYAVDAAYGMADEAADRFALNWINAALELLWRRHDWVHYQAEQRITLDPEETGTDAQVTAGSGDVVRGTPWLAKYGVEAWDLFLSGAEQPFRIASISSTTATLATGQVWIGPTATGVSYTLSRYRYSLPDNFVRRNTLVYDLLTRAQVSYRPPSEFDWLKAQNPGERSSQPRFYTLRGAGYVEFFPAPGSSYAAVRITYTRKPTLHTPADDSSTEVDWPEEFGHVLKLAVEAQAARFQGEAAQIPYAQVHMELERELLIAKGLDTDRGHQRRSISLDLSEGPWDLWTGTYRNPDGFTPA